MAASSRLIIAIVVRLAPVAPGLRGGDGIRIELWEPLGNWVRFSITPKHYAKGDGPTPTARAWDDRHCASYLPHGLVLTRLGRFRSFVVCLRRSCFEQLNHLDNALNQSRLRASHRGTSYLLGCLASRRSGQGIAALSRTRSVGDDATRSCPSFGRSHLVSAIQMEVRCDVRGARQVEPELLGFIRCVEPGHQ